MRVNKKSLHKSRIRQKKLIDDKFLNNTPTFEIPIINTPTRIQNENDFSKNDESYNENHLDKSA